MHQQTKGHVRPVWAAICLLAYLFSATPLLPIATVLLAWADGEHHVALSADQNGTRVVLGHDARDVRTALTHSHCVVSRVLTLLAEPSGPAHSDHVLNFHCGTASVVGKAMPLIAVPSAGEVPVVSALAATVTLPTLVTNVEAPLLDIPPPAMSVAVVSSTVFLI
jgi:hypothetical protein